MKEIQLGGHRRRNGEKLIKAWAFVDDEDFVLVKEFKWRLEAKGNYAMTGGKGNTKRMHRFILNPGPGIEIDHIDRNKLNNCRSNLRLVNRAENCHNSGPYKDNRSGYKGVYFLQSTFKKRRIKKWVARIYTEKRHFTLGVFETRHLAARAYNAAAVKFYGDKAFLNIVKDESIY